MRTWFWTLILFIAAVALALVLREHAGNVYLVTPHYLARASLTYVVLCTLGLFIVLYVLLRLLAWFSDGPERFRLWRGRRAQRRDQALLETGWISILEGRYEQAEKDLMKLMSKTRSQSSKVVAGLAAARAAHYQGQIAQRDEALAAARAAAGDDARLKEASAVASAELYLDQNRTEEAIELLQDLQDASSRHLHATRLLLRAYRQQGNAERVYELTRLLVRRSGIERQEALNHIEFAAAARLRVGGAEQFKALWSDLKSEEKILPGVALEAALIQEHEGNYEEAGRILEPAIAVSFDSRLLEAYAQCPPEYVGRRLAKAEEWLRSQPNNPVLLSTLGHLCLTSQLWGQGEHYLLRSLKIQGDLRNHALLGNLYDSLGRHDEAVSYWRKAASMAGTLPILAVSTALPAADTRHDPSHTDADSLPSQDDDDLPHYTYAASVVAEDLLDQGRPLPVVAEPVPPAATPSQDSLSSSSDLDDYFDTAPIPGVDLSQTSDRPRRSND
ncbi:heme biosynthesis HemY N-terminal domain-containing protein [Alcaligenes nematophilus]|uniref:heme biosynthesis HemY N-terminal domain-containing protein n=1 Tax=Alcaligenes nematophilus TaxID=2994643 RepID=UPI0034E0A426